MTQVLTREEVVERLARHHWEHHRETHIEGTKILTWEELGDYARTLAISRMNAVLVELQALGLVLVPVEPGQDAIEAGCAAYLNRLIAPDHRKFGEKISHVWEAMLAASPFGSKP